MVATLEKSKKSKPGQTTVGAPRKKIDPHSTNVRERFALHLRKLLDAREWGLSEFHRNLILHGMEVSAPAVQSWLSGRRIPDAPDLEIIAAVVIPDEDWRHILPPSPPKSRRK